MASHRDVQKLAGSLAVLLCDPSKVCLLHEVCQLLPASDQAVFDRVAASVIAEGNQYPHIYTPFSFRVFTNQVR